MRFPPSESLLRRLVRWTAWPILLAPATILLHELGHLVAAYALGFPDPQLHFSSISHGEISGRPEWHSGVVGLAGPAVTAMLLLLGLLLSWKRPRAPFGYALAVSAASRFFVGVPYTISNLVALAQGRALQPPQFDEYKAGEALGWSGDLTLGSTAMLFFVVVIWLALRLPKGERAVGWIGLISGTIVGWALWFTLAPFVIP